MSNRNKKNKQKSQPVTPDVILAVVRTLESHTSDPGDALMVLAATAHSLMTSLDVHIIESRTPDGPGIMFIRTDEENKQKAGRLHLH
ncbi:hypothetical protein [Salmonella enterica]|uniref:hypothetical protein n=1 Tax=Salmonella enterica TaxID=28901 RepID=UPI00193D9BE6|nr:hypothetical protein [Salmonella enterica]EEN5590195.1 hypothetical protein [Salmonella enterica subsp. enterica serovar Mountpleasant]